MKPAVKRAKSHKWWYISYGPTMHQNLYATWEQAMEEALKLNGGRRWR